MASSESNFAFLGMLEPPFADRADIDTWCQCRRTCSLFLWPVRFAKTGYANISPLNMFRPLSNMKCLQTATSRPSSSHLVFVFLEVFLAAAHVDVPQMPFPCTFNTVSYQINTQTKSWFTVYNPKSFDKYLTGLVFSWTLSTNVATSLSLARKTPSKNGCSSALHKENMGNVKKYSQETLTV